MAEQRIMHLVIAMGVIALFGIITFALAAATLGTLNKRFDTIENQVFALHNILSTPTPTPTTTAAISTTTTTSDSTTTATSASTATTTAAR